METITYQPRGVCSRHMEIDVDNGVIQAVRVQGGCSGNLQGICSLLKGMKVEDAPTSWLRPSSRPADDTRENAAVSVGDSRVFAPFCRGSA